MPTPPHASVGRDDPGDPDGPGGQEDAALRQAAPDGADAEAARARDAIAARLFGGGDAEPEPESRAQPERVARYVITGRLGAGGMGVVYRAYDPKLDREVAVKLLRPDSAVGERDSRARARLEREARAMAKLAHPNVIHVYDHGTHEDQVYVVMELVAGVDLARWLERARDRQRLDDGDGAFDWRAVLRLFLAAGEGLVAAHDVGLVHRDFKPENVLVGDDGRVRVLDFGLARAPGTGSRTAGSSSAPGALEVGGDDPIGEADTHVSGAGGEIGTRPSSPGPDRSDRSDRPDQQVGAVLGDGSTEYAGVLTGLGAAGFASLTRTGALVGTPRYMAAEQIRGERADARTDQFSFCVALFEGLYGTRAFSGRGVHEYLNNVLEGNVREPPADTVVPSSVWGLLSTGLEREAAKRHPSMRELLAALRECLEHDVALAVVPAPASSGRVVLGWVLGIGCVVLLGALAWGQWPKAFRMTDYSGENELEPTAGEGPSLARGGTSGSARTDAGVDDGGSGSTGTGAASAGSTTTPVAAGVTTGAADTGNPGDTTSSEPETKSTAKPRTRDWCSMHADRYTLLDRRRKRRAKITDRRGRCYTCTVEKDRNRVRRFNPSDCAHYQVCQPAAAEVCQ